VEARGDGLPALVRLQQVIRDFFTDYTKYPRQEGSSLNAAGIHYNSIKAAELLEKLQTYSSPRN
jgi:hypothetical protein